MDTSLARTTAAWIAAILLVFVATLFFYERHVERHEERQGRVFEFAKEYRDTFTDVRLRFSNNWDLYRSETIDPYNGGELDEGSYATLVERFLEQDTNGADFESLASFYGAVGVCVRAELCDFWMARAMFGSDILAFYHNMYPALQAEHDQPSRQAIFDFVARLKSADQHLIAEPNVYHVLDWD